ncbi:hypothetical protein BBI17_003491 [Phytophthora kernoviae]|uniref:Uncharacterized protein n=1 Tax=Phytophthora kernoviae TaxID=325452 RepID=A0A3R7JTF7_9STRA|nr:hypothetical protein BBI17_003491 [Phytophthora kernoviae]
MIKKRLKAAVFNLHHKDAALNAMTDLQFNTAPQSRAFLAPSISSFPPADIFYDPDYSDSDSDVEELFDADDFVSVAHDLLLVKLRCFRPKSEVSNLSAAFQREFGVVIESQQLEARLQKLQAPEVRALLVLYLKAVSNSTESQYSNNSGLEILPEYQSLLESTHSSCEAQLLQMMYSLDKSQHEASEMLAVEVSGRNFPKYTRTVSKTELRRCCKSLDDLFRRQVEGSNQAFTLYAAHTLNEKLLLTDTAPRYDSTNVFNHFEQPIFDRLTLFAKDPDIVERLALQRQQQVEAGRIKQQLSQQLQTIFETLRLKQAAKLEQLQAEEFENIKSQLDRSLEADLQHIRQMHTALLNHEQAKINAKYQEQKAVLTEKVTCMHREVMALQKKCDSSGWHGLERLIRTSSLQVERIFGTSEYLLRLLILAEDLNAESLRRALVRYISEEDKLPQFVLRRELTSKMIADTTILAILKQSTTKDLREVEGYGANFLHQDLVSRELHTRKVEFGRFLAGLTNDRLRAARRYAIAKKRVGAGIQKSDVPQLLENQDSTVSDADGDSQAVVLDAEFDCFASALEDFQEILLQEFARRREFSSVKMDSKDVERDVSFSSEDCVLQLESSHRYCTVHATKERRQGESGKWMFEVTIEMFGGDGESLLIGWEVPSDKNSTRVTTDSIPTDLPSSPHSKKRVGHTSSGSVVPGISPSDDGRSFGVTWQADGGLDMGMLHANGISKSGVPGFRAGDIIGCTIDQDLAVPQLRFYLNGDLTLPLRRTNNSGAGLSTSVSEISTNFGIAVANPAYRLVPVVSMYSSSKKPQMRVGFNFRGDFKFSIPGFDPFGAPL